MVEGQILAMRLIVLLQRRVAFNVKQRSALANNQVQAKRSSGYEGTLLFS